MNIVIYARFSSHSQTEQSIEGQLKVCYEYAEQNHYTVVGEYIDRALTGTNDNRVEFQRMIADSDKHTFEAVLVYQLDRFARNRYDSAINKAKLKKNGVRVLSAKENITDDASGILVEGVLESMAEYYSAELSQKICRGMSINAEKCLCNGSNPGLGYRVNADRGFDVVEDEAAVVREIFERYAKGEMLTDENIDIIIQGIEEQNRLDMESPLIVSLQADIRDTEKKIDRLIDQIEDGTASARVNERLQQRENELDSLKKQLHAERTKQEPVDPFAARLFLTGVRDASILDETFDKLLVNSLIDRIYLYDDHFRLLLNNSNKKSKTTKREAAEIERYFDNKGSDSALGAPPL